MELPVVTIVDLASDRPDRPAGRLELVDQIREANESVGFMVVRGHGVPDPVTRAMHDSCLAFFDLTVEEKLTVHPDDPTTSRGYMPLRSRALAYSRGDATPPDLVEFFASGKHDVDWTDPYYGSDRAGVHFHPNLWPERPVGMQAAWAAYYREMERLSLRLMRLFALALGLQEHWFDDSIDRHCSNLFANHYPAYDGPIEAGQLRLGAHTDYGSLTIVHQDGDIGGLQVRSGGRWVDVPAIPGTFVVNIGDLLARWTNDRWVSTLHRVVNPDAGRIGSSRRISIPFFHQPNYDARIECIPTCLVPGERPRHEPVLSGEHMLRKTNRTLDV